MAIKLRVFLLINLFGHLLVMAKSKDSTPPVPSPGPLIKSTPVSPIKTFRDFPGLETYDPLDVPSEQGGFPLEEGMHFASMDSLQNKKWAQMAANTFQTIEQTQNYVDVLTPEGISGLPVAIRPQEFNNIVYTVGVAKAVFKPAHSELTMFLKVDTPQGTLMLGAKDIKLSHSGGIIGDAKLSLISRFIMNFDNGTIQLALNGSFERPLTYATVDCSGFKELSLDANLRFSKKAIHPVDAKGQKTEGFVESSFKMAVTDWNDWILNISIPEFGVGGLPGVAFQVNNAVLDFSDVHNDPSTPPAYLSKYYPDRPELFRGVYVASLQVVLPPEFKKKNGDKRVAFGATDLILDPNGITGIFSADNLINIDEGSAAKWKLSLDHIMIDMEASNLKAGAISGEIGLPVSKEDRLRYNALFQPGGYTLQVASVKDINFDVWNTKVSLRKESFVELKVRDGKFYPRAVLHGNVNFATNLGKEGNGQTKEDPTVDFKGIVFEDMLLQAESPKFSVSYFGYKGKQQLANFPVILNEIGLRTPRGTDRAELLFNFNINLASESDGGNGAGTTLAIAGKLEDDNGRDQWKFDGVELERIFLEMDVSGTQLKGSIFLFDNDPVYGKGFAGTLGARFTMGVDIDIRAKALFGRTGSFRYWFADAQTTIPGGIPIFTGFNLNTFGGGIYQNMKMTGFDPSGNAAFDTIGASTSGTVYEPDKNSGTGFKAAVGITAQGSDNLFHATAEFGMDFRKSGGVQNIYFRGYGELISNLPADFSQSVLSQLGNIALGNTIGLPPTPPSGAMSIDLMIDYDFTGKIFKATSEIYVNFGILKGLGQQGRAGWLDMYASPEEWHLLVGMPDDPVGISMDLGFVRLDTRSYFMAGDGLPGSPAPPSQVADILGVDTEKLGYTNDLNKLKAGKGLAFGTRVDITTGDLRFLIFYARFDAGMGFDIMIKDYGEAHCKGASEQIGLNGWYANGQAYAYLQGELGLYFKLFGSKKKIPILKSATALLLQARLPNPSWFSGYLGGEYNLMGGLVKGRYRFHVELGEKCEVTGGSPIEGMAVIGGLSPKQGDGEVDVFTAPQVTFNMQLNKIFEIPDETGDRKYKIILDKFELTKDGNPIPGDIQWGDGNDVAVYDAHEILPPNSKLKSRVQLHFEEFKNGNWEVIKEDGKVSLETKETEFTTGEAPTNIPEGNIAFMYPVLGQQNMFPGQTKSGYIALKDGQGYLFASNAWEQEIRFESEAGEVLKQQFQYDTAKKQLSFALPKNLNTATRYTATVALLPPDTDIGANVSRSTDTRNLGGKGSGNTIEVQTSTAEGTVVLGEERELLGYGFRTSAFKTFDKKLKAIKQERALYNYITYPYGLTLHTGIRLTEPFDLIELVGSKQTGNVPLVQVRAILDDPYYLETIYPMLYRPGALPDDLQVNRDTDVIGLPPLEGVEPMSWYLTHLENGIVTETPGYNPYRYNLVHYYHQDFDDLRYQLITRGSMDNAMGIHKKLVTEPFPLMEPGTYKTKFSYQLPGSAPGKGKTVNYENPLYEK